MAEPEDEQSPGAPYPLPSYEVIPKEKPKPDCLAREIEILSRDTWGALPPTSETPREVLEVPFVIMTYTRTQRCKTQEECVQIIQQIQKKHMRRGLPDIKYRISNFIHVHCAPELCVSSFLVGGDGQVYEGRGWYNTPAENKGWPEVTNKCLMIAYIGNFKKPKCPPKKMVGPAWDLVEVGFVKDFVALGVRTLQKRHMPIVYNFHNVQPALGIDYF